MELTVTPAELGIAFRKAKVDLYYSTNPSLFAISDYEENLEENLKRLLKKINGRSTTWVKDSDFLGTWTLALWQFQSSHRSSNEGFKPVPDGFAMDRLKDRKVLPKGEA